MIKAVIDVGSNSVLLLVAQKQPNGQWTTIAEDTRVTGLGQNAKTTGLLLPDRQEETLQALQEFYRTAQNLGAQEIIAGGTMALRITKNAPEFFQKAADQNTPVQIVSGNQEAQLGFLAVAEDPLFASAPRLSIIDPGGHSTELVTADRTPERWKTRFRKSYPVGALGLRELTIPSSRPDFAERLATVDHIDALIGLEYLPRQCGQVVVLGATGTNLVTIREKMTTWQPENVHGQVLDFEEISRAVGWLCDMTDDQRAQVPGLEPGREKTIHIGALILERFMQTLHALECTVSVRGWRHALLDHPLIYEEPA